MLFSMCRGVATGNPAGDSPGLCCWGIRQDTTLHWTAELPASLDPEGDDDDAEEIEEGELLES